MNEKGVGAIIGVILMVAIVIAIAASVYVHINLHMYRACEPTKYEGVLDAVEQADMNTYNILIENQTIKDAYVKIEPSYLKSFIGDDIVIVTEECINGYGDIKTNVVGVYPK